MADSYRPADFEILAALRPITQQVWGLNAQVVSVQRTPITARVERLDAALGDGSTWTLALKVRGEQTLKAHREALIYRHFLNAITPPLAPTLYGITDHYSADGSAWLFLEWIPAAFDGSQDVQIQAAFTQLALLHTHGAKRIKRADPKKGELTGSRLSDGDLIRSLKSDRYGSGTLQNLVQTMMEATDRVEHHAGSDLFPKWAAQAMRLIVAPGPEIARQIVETPRTLLHGDFQRSTLRVASTASQSPDVRLLGWSYGSLGAAQLDLCYAWSETLNIASDWWPASFLWTPEQAQIGLRAYWETATRRGWMLDSWESFLQRQRFTNLWFAMQAISHALGQGHLADARKWFDVLIAQAVASQILVGVSA